MLISQEFSQLNANLTDALTKMSLQRQTLHDLLLIQQQADLIRQITQTSKIKKNTTLSTDLSQLSFESVEPSQAFNCSISGVISRKNLQIESFEDELEEALSEIRESCSKKAFNTIRRFLRTKTQTSQNEEQKILQRDRQNVYELKGWIKKLNQQNVQYQAKIKKLEEELKLHEDEKKLKQKNIQANMEKQHRIVKFQIGLLHKEKMHAEIKKNLKNQQKYIKEQQQNNLKFKEYLDETLKIISNMEVVAKCEGSCWRADIITQCRANLNKQRQLLQIQSELAESHYLQIRQIVEQLKLSLN